ncbi:MAG: TraB/GumN family protein [Terricaulis sp.]
MRAFVLAVCVGLAWTLGGCTAAPPSPALWRIADADSEIWLLGTVHVLPQEVQWRSARIDAAFTSANELVLETDASPEGGAALGALTARYGWLPAGETLSARVGAEVQPQIIEAAALARLDPASLQPLRPWFAALQLSVGQAIANGQDPSAGVEPVLFAEATAHGRTISFFETPEEQIRMLADLPPADEDRFFLATLRQMKDAPDAIERLQTAWLHGDVAALQSQIEPELREAGPAVYEALMTRRNRAWADAIAQRLQGSGDVFIAVGAGHLVGPESVIALLRARGIEVEGP